MCNFSEDLLSLSDQSLAGLATLLADCEDWTFLLHSALFMRILEKKSGHLFLVLQNGSYVYFLLFLSMYGNICIYTSLSLVHRLNSICNCLFKYFSSLVNNSCNAISCNTYFGQWNTEDSPSTECKSIYRKLCGSVGGHISVVMYSDYCTYLFL